MAVVRIGAHEGEISDGESAMVHNIINLEEQGHSGHHDAEDRDFFTGIELASEEATRALDQKGFSRIPILTTNGKTL